MSRLGYYKPWYLVGSIVTLIPAVLMCTSTMTRGYFYIHANQDIATIVKTHPAPGVLYGLEIALGLGAGAYTQASFAVIQAVTAPSEAANGLTLMLLGSSTSLFN